MAFMHHRDISEETFRRAATNLPRYKPVIPESKWETEARIYLTGCLKPYLDWSAFLDHMIGLLSYSLVTYDQGSKACTLHVLVHDWASTVVNYPIYIAIKHTSLLLALSIDYDNTPESLEYKCKVEPHVTRLLGRQPRLSANKASRFAEAYYRSGMWQQQEEINQIELASTREVLGEENDTTLISMRKLEDVYSAQGRYQEAVVLLEQVVETRKLVSGPEHFQTLRAMDSLALRILDTSNRTHDHEHPYTLHRMHQLAYTYQAEGQYEQAEALLVKVVDAEKRVKGGEHT
ncbi:kinesin light chain [Ceratobasidium sp. AG-Ba]|nr:kinesin light chain [Ceratobasidium sp. AG-Ba]QRW10164.1 kinesin light chain [Ceratobasidium sp. AG-Ba]